MRRLSGMLGSLGRLVARCHPCYMASRCIQILRACLLVNVAESLPAFSENQRQSKRISAAKPVGIFFSFVFFLFCCVVGGVFVFHSFLPFDFLFSISSCCHLLVLFVISYFMFAYSNFQKKKKMNENKDQWIDKNNFLVIIKISECPWKWNKWGRVAVVSCACLVNGDLIDLP